LSLPHGRPPRKSEHENDLPRIVLWNNAAA
jgi:hypothetical protein